MASASLNRSEIKWQCMKKNLKESVNFPLLYFLFFVFTRRYLLIYDLWNTFSLEKTNDRKSNEARDIFS